MIGGLAVLADIIVTKLGAYLTETVESVSFSLGCIFVVDSTVPRGRDYFINPSNVIVREPPLEVQAWWTWPYGIDVAPPVVETYSYDIFRLGDL